jgi:creatinine amidohydrolase
MRERLADWRLDDEDAGRKALLVLPLGAIEQHGPHLPYDTDVVIAVVLAERLARHRHDCVVAPAMPYGSSGEHAGFPGVLSIGIDLIETVIVEIGRSARASFAGLVVVSAHGGNAAAVARARERLEGEGQRTVAWTARFDGGDAHAGYTETSLMLALQPVRVAVERMEPGVTAPIATLMKQLRREGLRAVSANGVLGDPRGASAEAGLALLDRAAADLIECVNQAFPDGEPPP